MRDLETLGTLGTLGTSIELGGIVLAGGHSSRMGREKALLEWAGEPLVQRAVRLLQTVCVDVLVVTASEAVRKVVTVRTVADEQPGLGPVGGLHAGLRAATQEYNCVVACDMPWINPAALQYMAQWAPGHNAVALRRATGWEPLHALYARRGLPSLETSLAAGELKLSEVCERLNTWAVTEAEWQRFDPDFRAFRNLNTPADYICALAESVE